MDVLAYRLMLDRRGKMEPRAANSRLGVEEPGSQLAKSPMPPLAIMRRHLIFGLCLIGCF